MKIIIVGCGKVGQELVRQLDEGNSITVIDIDETRANDIAAKYDCTAVIGNGAIHDIQKEAGINKADLLIAVTGSDELNMLCCLVAKMTGKCQTIARIRNPEYANEARYLKNELRLAMLINPELDAASEIERVLRFPSAMKIDTFAKGRVELLKFRLPEDSPLVGCAVKDIYAKFHCDVLVCTVERGDEAYITKGDFVFKEKDIVSVIATPRNANTFFRKINYKINSAKNVMIVGGDSIAHYLCENLHKNTDINITLIEKDAERCDALSSVLDYVNVINGDAIDQDILLQEGLETVGAFTALTELDEENIILSLFAQKRSNAKIVTKIRRIDFDDVINELELDTIINPINIAAENIARYVRAMGNTIGSNLETLYTIIKEYKIEASEYIIKEDSPVVGIPLSEMPLKKDVLVAAIIRGGKALGTPRGGDTILPGDSVVIISKQLEMHDISDILR